MKSLAPFSQTFQSYCLATLQDYKNGLLEEGVYDLTIPNCELGLFTDHLEMDVSNEGVAFDFRQYNLESSELPRVYSAFELISNSYGPDDDNDTLISYSAFKEQIELIVFIIRRWEKVFEGRSSVSLVFFQDTKMANLNFFIPKI